MRRVAVGVLALLALSPVTAMAENIELYCEPSGGTLKIDKTADTVTVIGGSDEDLKGLHKYAEKGDVFEWTSVYSPNIPLRFQLNRRTLDLTELLLNKDHVWVEYQRNRCRMVARQPRQF